MAQPTETAELIKYAAAVNTALAAAAPRDPEPIFTGHVFSIGPSPRHATITDVITSRGGTIYDVGLTPDAPEPENLIR